MNVVAYLRVSTRSQGDSGLGLEAQREYIAQAAHSEKWTVVAEYVDVASGAIAPMDRPECAAAIAHAASVGAVLVVAKLDRLSRDVEHIAGLIKRTNFKVATMPKAEILQLHLYAMLAEQERTFISQRTKAALASLKKRADGGDAESIAKIGRRDAGRAKANLKGNGAAVAGAVQVADAYAESCRHALQSAAFTGVRTLAGVAEYLTAQGIKSPRGALYTPTTAARLIKRLGVTFP
ncbi:MAG: recombinase family protein [Pseudomonas sp.]